MDESTTHPAAADRAVNSAHPYHPQHVSIPGYVPNSSSISSILGAFGGLIFVFVACALLLARRCNPAIRKPDQLALCWFAICGFLHCFFEGYFVLYHASLPSSQALFAQLWKEYAQSDSRYVTSDPFMLCIETLTVLIWGPLSIAAAVCIVQRNPLRHLAQAVLCVGHLYGVALYYGTCYFEETFRGVSYSRPEFLYFWVYYVGFNAPWVVGPALLLRQSAAAIRCSFVTRPGEQEDASTSPRSTSEGDHMSSASEVKALSFEAKKDL
ncbi:Emopamil binding protein-domain-containing protein [Podospora appendiculata]|uniref:Emopamil binding protein-domain-containing protein n=1 Tax=Podospora appendiculata TaxID=314037 RepID=A0AAE0XFH3_9PEZI|nr:Emopamil binding protein-domain-containing protein [Podospora appendiculata]